MIRTVQTIAAFDGELGVFDHESSACNCTMRFAVYKPPQAKDGKIPVLWYLSGLTCNWSNVMEKGGVLRLASEHGLMVIAPDTSPRGDSVADDEAYDLGQGAGFYINSAQGPWAANFQMESYIVDELPELIGDQFVEADMQRQGITGHSMGGHGAITLHLKYPDKYRSVSAFSPIVAPTKVPWGQKAFTAYLGDDESVWKKHDACELVRTAPSDVEILVDQGMADNFLDEQLQTHLFAAACAESTQKVEINMREGYDHSYYFVSSFMPRHFEWHAAALNA